MQPKIVIVNDKATITTGILEGHVGLVVGYDSEENEVWIELDDQTFAVLQAEMITQKNKENEC